MTKGTREWSDVSFNFESGCKEGCEYCYARMMSDKYKRKDWDDWTNIQPLITKKPIKKYNGIIMFPTTHNITMEKEYNEKSKDTRSAIGTNGPHDF